MPTAIAERATRAITTGSDGERRTNTDGAITIQIAIETDISRRYLREALE
jgi:hypothetical protein